MHLKAVQADRESFGRRRSVRLRLKVVKVADELLLELWIAIAGQQLDLGVGEKVCHGIGEEDALAGDEVDLLPALGCVDRPRRDARREWIDLDDSQQVRETRSWCKARAVWESRRPDPQKG